MFASSALLRRFLYFTFTAPGRIGHRPQRYASTGVSNQTSIRMKRFMVNRTWTLKICVNKPTPNY